MKKSVFRSRLLCIGMVCFSLAVSACLINILFFPYARNLFNMTFPRFCVIGTAFFLILIILSRFLKRTNTAVLERCTARLIPVFACILLLLMLVCGYFLAHKPFCDNAYVFKAAQVLNSYGGIPPEVDSYVHAYMLHFPNQWGFALLLSLIPFESMTTAFGSHSILYLLSVIQSFLFVTAILALLLTVNKCFGVRAELMLLFSLFGFLPLYPAAAVLYTDTFSMPFVLFALCCILRIDHASSYRQIVLPSLCCGFSLLIGCMIKMTSLILFIAAAIVWLLTLNPKRAAVCILIPLLILTGGMKAVNYHMTHQVFQPEEAARYKTPLLHWVMMSIPTENNFYGSNTDDYNETWALMEQGASHEEIMQSIYTRIHEKLSTYNSFKNVISAVLRKNANYIGDGTFGMWEMLDDSPLRETALSTFFLYYGQHYPLYADLCGGIWLAHLTRSVLICANHLRKRSFHLSIPMITFLGLLIFEMLWEARSRYVFNLAPLILLISACGTHTETKE